MNCKLKLSLILFFVYLHGFAQNVSKDSSKLVSMAKIEFNFSGLGVNYELPIGKNLSLDNGIGFATGVQVLNDRIHYEYKITNPVLYAKSELKYYYNRYVRVAKKLPTSLGQGSYFAWQNKYNTQRFLDDKYKLSNTILIEAHWGIQRMLWETLLFNTHIGIGRAFDFTTKGSSGYLALGVRISYIIPSLNKF